VTTTEHTEYTERRQKAEEERRKAKAARIAALQNDLFFLSFFCVLVVFRGG
jgi:hypothetical protein